MVIGKFFLIKRYPFEIVNQSKSTPFLPLDIRLTFNIFFPFLRYISSLRGAMVNPFSRRVHVMSELQYKRD